MNYRKVLVEFLKLASRYLPPPLNLFVGVLIDYLVELIPQTEGQMFAAPTQLKDWLTKTLTAAANEINNRILRRVALKLIPLVETLADDLWDKLFEQNVVDTPRTGPKQRGAVAQQPADFTTADLEKEALEDLG